MQKRANTLVPAAAQAMKIAVMEDADSATIMLYGYIGENWKYDYESGEWKDAGITDLGFVEKLTELASKYSTIKIRINSLGGSVYHGSAMLTAMQNCTALIETYNDGHACSMAADIWMMGKRRHMAKNAMMMLHPAAAIAWGNANAMRDMAEYLDKATESIITATADAVGKTADEIRSKYYSTGKDVWLNYTDAVADGLINGDDTYQAEGVAEGLEKMSYLDIQKQYLTPPAATATPEAEPGWVQKLITAIMPQKNVAPTPSAPAESTHTNHNTVNLEDLKKALADGTFTPDQVQAELDAHKAATTPPVDPVVAALQQQLADLTTKFAALAAAPGTAHAAPPVPAADPADNVATPGDLEKFNRQMEEARKQGINPMQVTEL